MKSTDEGIKDSEEIKSFLKFLKENNLLNFFLSQIKSKYVERNYLDDSEIYSDVENISYERDLMTDDDNKSCENNPFNNVETPEININTEQNLIEKNNNFERQVKNNIYKKQNSFNRLTNDDVEVLNKIVKISLIIIIICSLLIIIGVLMKTTNILSNSQGTLALVIVSFNLELISFYFIFKLFLVEIHRSEYENLKIIAEIEKYLKNNKEDKKTLHFDEIRNSSIYRRLSGFMKISIPNNV